MPYILAHCRLTAPDRNATSDQPHACVFNKGIRFASCTVPSHLLVSSWLQSCINVGWKFMFLVYAPPTSQLIGDYLQGAHPPGCIIWPSRSEQWPVYSDFLGLFVLFLCFAILLLTLMMGSPTLQAFLQCTSIFFMPSGVLSTCRDIINQPSKSYELYKKVFWNQLPTLM